MNDGAFRRQALSFTQEQGALFSAFSGDRNPLHLDPGYARRTPHGRPVFFGVAGILAAIGEWADGRAFRLTSMRARFDQPLFTGLAYTMEWAEHDGKVELKILKGIQPRVRMTFCWEGFHRAEDGTAPSAPPFQPLTAARERTRSAMPTSPTALDPYPYEPNWTLASHFQELFGLSLVQWPRRQLSWFLFASYFIGMDWPGSQALFAELKVDFGPSAGAEAAFEPANMTMEFHDHVSLLEVSGSSGGQAGFNLKAFLRPTPVAPTLSEVQASVGASTAMSGQKVLVTGASRGFGAVLAMAFALQGADVGLSYRSSHAEAWTIQAQLAACPGRMLLLPGDLGQREDCARLFSTACQWGPLDLLVCNASPTIEAKPYLAQTPEECLGFVQDSLALLVGPLHEMLPALRPGATVVYVSSAYMNVPQANLSHYLAAKGAAEGLLRGLAEEFKRLRFILVRPPRMLTDQTNSPFDREPGVSAIPVAQALLDALKALAPTPGLQELDL